MNVRALVGAAVAAIAVAGLPAEAACIGCGGAAARGAAAVKVNATGAHARHAVEAQCSYRSVPSAGSYVGSFSGSVTATEVPTEPVTTQVSCTLHTKSGSWSLDAQGGAHAAAGQQVPPLLEVVRICVNASASWVMTAHDADSAAGALCQTPGLAADEVRVDLPGGSR